MSGFWIPTTTTTTDPAPTLEVSDVSAGDSYESWPIILKASNGDLVTLYGDGSQHTPTTSRKVLAQVSDDQGVTWGPTITVTDTANDEAVFGGGVDSSGNLLAWIRSRTGAGAYNGHRLVRSTNDGATWADLVNPSWSPMPILLWDVIAVPTVGLMSMWHSGTVGSSNWAWGTATSDDDGATWTQTTIASGLTQSTCPVEIEIVYVGDGKILGVARVEDTGVNLFQIQSDDYGATWSTADTNIAEEQTPVAMVLHDDLNTLDLYYYDRDDGKVEYLRTTIETVWDAPTAWPATEVLTTEAGTGSDAGYVDAIRTGSVNVVVYYTGSTNTQVKALRHGTDDAPDHPSLDVHDRLGLATQAELDAHTHAAASGELLMQDGVTSPPVPIETEAGDDWLYED